MPFSLKWRRGHPKALELVAFVDGELQPAQRRAVFAHLASCADCSRELTLIQEAERLIREAGSRGAGRDPEAAGRLRSLIAAHRAGLGQGVRKQVENLLGARLGEVAERAACAESSAERGISAVNRELETFLGRRTADKLRSRLAAANLDEAKPTEPVE